VEALTIASVFRPRIAILDIGLPVMDGYQLARELRSRLSDDPARSSRSRDTARSKIERATGSAGFAHHFAKPVDVSELLRVLDGVSTS